MWRGGEGPSWVLASVPLGRQPQPAQSLLHSLFPPRSLIKEMKAGWRDCGKMYKQFHFLTIKCNHFSKIKESKS